MIILGTDGGSRSLLDKVCILVSWSQAKAPNHLRTWTYWTGLEQRGSLSKYGALPLHSHARIRQWTAGQSEADAPADLLPSLLCCLEYSLVIKRLKSYWPSTMSPVEASSSQPAQGVPPSLPLFSNWQRYFSQENRSGGGGGVGGLLGRICILVR